MEEQSGYRIHEWGGDLSWDSFPLPEPGPGEVAVRVEACGIGLTVLNCMNGDLADDAGLLPRVPGHELVGTVTALGPGVVATLMGRRVVAYFYLSCGSCQHCVAGDDSRCAELDGWVGVHRDGGYAPWTVLPARNAVPIPAALDPVDATVVADAVATPLHVCRARARVSASDRVAVFGAGGGIGIHMIQMARLLGARVVGLDLQAAKLDAVEQHGARGVLADDLGSLDPALWSEGPPTVVIDLVGSAQTLAWGAAALAMGGRLIVLTTFRDRELHIDPRESVFREISVIGSRYANRAEVAAAAELVATGRIAPVISKVVGPDGVPAVHDDLRSGELLGRGALRWAAAD